MRRRFGRFLRQGNSEGPQVPPALRQANQWMANGNYAAAATAFEDLAQGTERRNGPRAPFFFLQAGRARMMLEQYDKSVAHFKHGLTLLIDSGRFTLLYRAGTRIVQELKDRGRDAEAREIAALVHGNTLAISESATQQLPSEKLTLPMHCPSCGGPLRSDEADWIDDITAECPFCGSSVRVQ